MRRQQESHIRNADQLSLQAAKQMANTKNFAFRRGELYATVKPPVSKCYPEITTEYLMDAIQHYGYRHVINRLDTNQVERKEKKSTDSGKSSVKSKPFPDKKNTPREVKRMLNRKAANFQQWETSPSVSMTPVLKSDSQLSITNGATSQRSGRPFHMDHDDIVEVWRRIPNKDTLGYYGVGAGKNKPEAVVFNQVIEKCLNKVKPPEVKGKPLKTPAVATMPSTPGHQPYVLNRTQLKAKVDNMASLNLTKAISWLHCPRSLANVQPFFQSETLIGKKKTGAEKRSPKSTPLRRRQKQPKGELINYECMEPKKESAYELAYRKEMEKLEKEIESEPKDYDELFSKLITCFQRNAHKDSLYEAYKSCKGSSQHGFMPDLSGATEIGGAGDIASGGANTGLSTEGSVLRRVLDEVSERDAARRSLLKDGSTEKTGSSNSGPKRASKGASQGASQGAGDGRGSRGGPSGSRGGPSGSRGSGKSKTKAKTDAMRASTKNKMPTSEQKPFDVKFRNKQHSFIMSSSSTHRSMLSTDYFGDNSKNFPPDKSDTYQAKKRKPYKKNMKAQRKWSSNVSRYNNTRGKDCQCVVCNFMERRDREPDSPLINQLKEEEKRRKLREYYNSMRHREQIACAPKEYRAPQRKCEPIKEESCFCTSRKWGEYLDRLDALQDLQKSYGHMDRALQFKVKALKDRLCWQICEGLQNQRKMRANRH
ncbi:uncharacterized protein LOC116803888 [Drosophila mojavensis]|uniref:uncharacterized protein LOC116803888 n=1 Tax=Drosophila mojavensis TaxID=7230 RepID=UPI0013EE89F6|nr:uncharacterized protein LOC116803888 [Drosophila mojavensis]